MLHEWIEARAEETGRSREEVLARAVTVARLIDDHDEALGDAAPLDGAAGTSTGELPERIADLTARVDDLDAELDEKIDDVRSRVIQVKREADAKAEADHDHPKLREATESVDDLEAELDDLGADVESIRTDLSELEESFDAGFANYEEVLEYLTDTADDHEEKLSRVAAVVSDVRTRVSTLEARETRRLAAADLKAEANRLGVASADCNGCGATVRLSLLSTPECPHCEATFEAVEPASGFFGSPSLTVGTRPALEGETVDEQPTEPIFEDE